jgi:prefoldin subunit 5
MSWRETDTIKLDFEDLVKELDQFEQDIESLQSRIDEFMSEAQQSSTNPVETADAGVLDMADVGGGA